MPDTPPGQLKLEALQGAGFSGQEIQNWQTRTTQQLQAGGFSQAEIANYWGHPQPDDRQLGAQVQANMSVLDPKEHARVAQNPIDMFRAGLQMSSTSLLTGPPNVVPPEHAGTMGKILEGAGQFVGDIPASVAGFVGGTAAGAAIPGFGETVLGPLATGGAGAAALPEAMRQVLMDHYRNGTAASWDQVWSRTASIIMGTSKAALTGAIAAPAGGLVGAAVGSSAANLAAQAAAGAVVGAALEGHVPSAEDFITGAVLALGFHGAGKIAGAAKRFIPSPEAERVASNLQDIYEKTGVDPKTISRLASADPALLSQILAPRRPDGERDLGAIQQIAPPEPEPFKPHTDVELPPRPPQPEGAPEPPTGESLLPLIHRLEGSGDNAVSPAGAIGRAQIMPGTARQYGFDPTRLHDPEYNAKVATHILDDLLQRFDGDIPATLVAYNAGPMRAAAWIKGGRVFSDLPIETQHYLEHAERLGAFEHGYNAAQTERQLAAWGDTRDDWPGEGQPPAPPPEPPGEVGPANEPGERPKPFELNADMLADQVLDIVGEEPSGGLPDWLNPRKIIAQFQSQLTPARRLDERLLGSEAQEHIGAEDMLRQTFASKERAGFFVRYGVLDPITLERKSDASYLLAHQVVKDSGGDMKKFMAYRLAQRTIEKAEQGPRAEAMARAEAAEAAVPPLAEARTEAERQRKVAEQAYFIATEDRQNRTARAKAAAAETETARKAASDAERTRQKAATAFSRSKIARDKARARLDAARAAYEKAKGGTQRQRDAIARIQRRTQEWRAARDSARTVNERLAAAQKAEEAAYREYVKTQAQEPKPEELEAAAKAEELRRQEFAEAQSAENRATHAHETALREATRLREEAKQTPGIATGVDLDLARNLIERLRTESPRELRAYERGADIIRQVKDGAIDYARDSGLFGPEQAEQIKALNREHIVFRRIIEPDYTPPVPGRGFGVRTPVKKMAGSDRQIVDPITADIDNLHTIVAMADRNRAIGSILNMIRGMGDPELDKEFTEVEAPRETQPGSLIDENGLTIENAEGAAPFETFRKAQGLLRPGDFTFMRNGKMEIWHTNDHDLADVLRMPAPGRMNPVAQLFAKVASLGRAGITAALDFPFRAVMHGQLAASALAPHGSWLPYHDVMAGWMDVWNQGPAYRRWVANGGAGAALTDMDTNYLRKDIERVWSSTGSDSAVWNALRHPIDAMRTLQHMVDAAARVGYMKRAENQGLSTLKAATESRRAYLDHAELMSANWVNTWARMVPFMPIGFKDVEQVTRALRERPLGTLMKAGAILTMPTVLNYATNLIADQFLPEKDRYDQVPQWERDMYWVLPPVNGVRLKIKKPYVAGWLFSTLPERFLDTLRGQQKSALDWARSLMDQALPPMTPSVIAPALQQYSNTSWTGRPLIPSSLEKASGYMQYKPDTSLTARKIATVLGPPGLNIADVSPIVIENYAREWSGTLPMTILGMLEAPFRPPSRPWQIADTPFAGSFFVRQTPGDAQSIQDFYEQLNRVEAANTDLRLALKQGNFDALAPGERQLAALKLSHLETALRAQSAVVTAINQNKDMTADEKRKYTDSIAANMLLLAKEGLAVIKGYR